MIDYSSLATAAGVFATFTPVLLSLLPKRLRRDPGWGLYLAIPFTLLVASTVFAIVASPLAWLLFIAGTAFLVAAFIHFALVRRLDNTWRMIWTNRARKVQ